MGAKEGSIESLAKMASYEWLINQDTNQQTEREGEIEREREREERT